MEHVVNYGVKKVTHNNLKGGNHLKVGKRSYDYASGKLVWTLRYNSRTSSQG